MSPAIANRLAWIVYAAIWVVAVGYWVVPPQPRARSTDAPRVEKAEAAPVHAAGPAAMAMTVASAPAITPDPSVRPVTAVPVTSPELHERIRPVLNRGTNLAAASAGFRDATEFAAVAHAARNVKVPFMVLKHRVVHDGMSLADAIHASLPQANAEVEAELAFARARQDVAALSR